MALPSDTVRLIADVAEIALADQTAPTFWPAVLERLARSIPFDAGFIAATSGTVAAGQGAVIGHDERQLRMNIGRYLAEISPHEVTSYADQARDGREVWGPRRRRELAVFHELMEPAGTRHLLVRASHRQDTLLGFNLERRGLARPFTDGERHLLDAVAPVIDMGVHLLRKTSDGDVQLEEWAAQYELTSRERDITRLVSRGLRNGEVAQLLGLSANTVRNMLARVFAKTNVSTRTELVFVTGEVPARGSLEAVNAQVDGVGAFAERVRQARQRLAEPSDRLAPDRATIPRSIVYSGP
jgi:DNA-binding CsgD family transcriptional regulator